MNDPVIQLLEQIKNAIWSVFMMLMFLIFFVQLIYWKIKK